MFRNITRRTFNRLLGRAVVVASIAGGATPSTSALAVDEAAGMSSWPSKGDWARLFVQVKGPLIEPTLPIAACSVGTTVADKSACDAAGLFMIAGTQQSAFMGVKGHELDMVKGKASHTKMCKAYSIIETATPFAGSYVNESSCFDEDLGTCIGAIITNAYSRSNMRLIKAVCLRGIILSGARIDCHD